MGILLLNIYLNDKIKKISVHYNCLTGGLKLKVGYARVSSTDQNLSRQLKTFKNIGIKKVFKEKKSGKSTSGREELQKLLEFIHDDDEVVIDSLNRLGRNSTELTELISEIHYKHATLTILDFPQMDQIQSKELKQLFTELLIAIYKYNAEQERLDIKRRQAEGIQIAKEKGLFIGKQVEYSEHASDPKKRLVYQSVVRGLKRGDSVTSIAKFNGITRNTVYRIKKDLK